MPSQSFYIFINRLVLALAKQGDNALGRIHLSILLSICLFAECSKEQ